LGIRGVVGLIGAVAVALVLAPAALAAQLVYAATTSRS